MTIPQPDVKALVRSVTRSIGVRKSVDPKPLRTLFAKHEYIELVGAIKRALQLDMQLVVGIVRTGGHEGHPAWIGIPESLPPYGTDAFRKTKITVFIRKAILEDAPFDTVVKIIAHEMSHIVLAAIGNPLWKDERAVDVTAMVLGFAEFYERGTERCKTTITLNPAQVRGVVGKFLQRFRLMPPSSVMILREHIRYGYLTKEEVAKAASEIRRLRT